MLSNLKWKKYYPLSDKNAYICLVDVMGDDSAVVQAARVSYNKDLQDGDNNDIVLLNCIQQIYPEVNSYELYDCGNTTGEHSLKLIFNDGRSEISSVDFKRKIYNNANIARDKILRNDRNLIRYLMNHSHTTPFEMVEIKFMVQVPMDHWRQWVRHRTASINEYSTRYTEALDFFQVTSPQEWRLQATDNKQGSSGYLTEWPEGVRLEDDYISDSEGLPTSCQVATLLDKRFLITEPKQKPGSYLSEKEKQFHQAAQELYQIRLDLGIAKEQARKDLPLSTYTRAYWKCDLHNIFNFLRLRMDSHAQLEIRQFANCMYEIVKQLCPVSCEAFEDYILHAKKFSRMEMEIIKSFMSKERGFMTANNLASEYGMTDREWKEFLGKLS